MPHPVPSSRRRVHARRSLHLLIALLLALGSILAAPPSASAESPGELQITKEVEEFEPGEQVEPGQTFVYTITISCTNTGTGGCTNAVLEDSLPAGLLLDDDASDITIVGANGSAAADGNDITVTFTDTMVDPEGEPGLLPGTATIQIPVRVDPDIDPALNGQNLTNTATVDATNTESDSDSFTVVPDIPVELAASTDKSFNPGSAIADPGTETTMTLTGGNDSNVPVEEITLTDPTDPPGAFTYLALTGDLEVTLPPGAEQVQIDCFAGSDWQNGTPSAPPATLPSSVADPADCEGIRIHFISTDGADIAPGASGSIDVGLEQRDNIASAGEGPINNEVSTTVTIDDETSDPITAEDDYTITSADLPLEASKVFEPDVIPAGGESTVTLGATNTSDRTLDSLTITEPGGDPNMFENGLTFSGWGDIQWPRVATGAEITYTYADGSTETLTANPPGTLPDPPADQTVVGFSVTFTGDIVAGAEVSLPFTVTADDEQAEEEIDHLNIIEADSTAPGGYTGNADANDTITTIEKRLEVEVEKEISPDEIFSIPGQEAVVELTGKVSEFPESTTDANQIIVQDPADLSDQSWYDAFNPQTIAETPIPADATMTVQYWNGSEWVTVPGMDQIPGEAIFTGDLPPDVQENAQGIRFVYESEEGFPPGTTVGPNIVYELDDAVAGQELTLENCAASSASSPEVADPAEAAQESPNCPTIDIIPPTPGNADFFDKEWDSPKLVGERSGAERGVSLRWSTSGANGIDQMRIFDVPEPSEATLPESVYDSFDLVGIDRITPELDPLLTYDRVRQIRLYSRSADTWIAAPGDPCPAACDGTFPGYPLSAEQQSDIIGFALIFEESPTRADRITGNPTAPPVGSGVARSSGNDRTVHATFRLRDELRSDPTVPVIADQEYNVDSSDGEVRNDASAEVWVDNRLIVEDTDSDIIVITDVPVTADITKDWDGGPLGVPEPGTADFPAQYPTGRVSIDGHNTTPRKVDRLTISEPTGGEDPFDIFNLKGFVDITEPASIGATDVQITLNPTGPNTRTLTRDEALAATEDELSDVVGFTIVYTGRIAADAHALVSFDTRLRDTHRESGADVTSADSPVDNEASVLVEDLVDYPNVDPETQDDSDDASIELQPRGIDLEVTKTISPATQTEPDRNPVSVTLTGQPQGPSRTNWMQLVDEDTTFFNAYDFVDFAPFNLTAPIDRVQVDAFVGGTFTAGGDGVVRTGGDWVLGTPGTALSLPDGVSAADVQGVRFTFTKEDGTIWENPSTPTQSVVFRVQRRLELRTGGPVETDLGDPAPGEENPGQATDTIQGENRAADQGPDGPLTATDEATDDIVYLHSRNAVEVAKSPSDAQPPGTNIPYVLTFTNTGDTPITNPVITDHLPSDGDGPLLVYDPNRTGPGTGYTFTLTGDEAPDPPNGDPMPTTTPEVDIDESATQIVFTFPEDTVLEVGQTYTITTPLQFRPGLPGDTDVTNTVGITGDRPWDECEETLDEDSGECQADTTVYPTRAGALRGVKSVKASDDELGVLDTRDSGCTADDYGFYVGGCVPVTKPGEENIWRMTFTNTGNLPQDKVYAIDRLPTPGDTGAISTTLERESEWTPTPTTLTYRGAELGDVTALRVSYDTDQDLCTLDLDTEEGCPDGAWTLIEEIQDPDQDWAVDLPANATALLIEAEFEGDSMLQPTGTLTFDLTTVAPAQSPTEGADTIAWNTVASAAETNDNGTLRLVPKTEGNKVGAALATGRLEVEKKVDGPASEYAPDSFALTVQCTSVDEEVDLGDQAEVTATANEVTPVDVDIPWGSVCTVTEDAAAAGNPQFEVDTVIIGRAPEVVRITATNTYPNASLSLAKEVVGSAVDQDGNPISYGPFTFTVDCSYLGEPVYADGYSADEPMTAELSSGADPVVFTELPAGAECTATETNDWGASSTSWESITGTGTADEEADEGSGTTVDLVLTPDGEDPVVTNTVTFTNTFDTGSLVITKEITGDGADRYGAGPFVVHLRCVDAREPRRAVYDGDLVLGGEQPLMATVQSLYVNSICRVTETNTGGATTVTVSPEGTFAVTAASQAEPVQVSVTNRFDVGGLRVIKKIDDPDGLVGDDQLFWFQLRCVRSVDGTPQPVELEDDGRFNLSIDGGLSQTWDDLPTGAVCTVTETDDGGANATTIEPGQVIVGSDTTVDVLATNTFDPLPPSPEDESEENEERLPSTGGPHLALLVIGLALVAGGGLLIRRRRRG